MSYSVLGVYELETDTGNEPIIMLVVISLFMGRQKQVS